MAIDYIIAQKLEKIKTRLVLTHAFFGVLLSMLDIKEDGYVGTMGTNGINLYYNRKFVDHLTDEQLTFVLMHEIMHVAYMHVGDIRMQDRNATKWNFACDIVINNELSELCRRSKMYKILPGVLIDERFINKTAEYVYNNLPDNKRFQFTIGRGSCPKCGGAGSYRDKCGTCDGTGVTNEKCDRCNGSGKVKDENGERECPSCKGSGEENSVCQNCGGSGSVGKEKECDCGGGDNKFHEGDLLQPANPDVLNEIKDKVMQAYEATKKLQGFVPAGLVRSIEDMMKPKVPWQKIFLRFLGNALARDDYSFAKPNRRFLSYDDIIMPDLRNNIVGNVVIAVDTSGSISHGQLSQFAAELKKVSHLVNETTVITCDASVHEVVKLYQMDSFLKKIKFKGGGGTNFTPVFDYIEKYNLSPEVMIYLTDSYGTFPKLKPNYPVIWILTHEEQIKNVPWGEKAVIPNCEK